MNLYLESTKLSGYKTIEDVDISFSTGLNIIIGKNSSGKTNFLSFLYSQLRLENEQNINFSSYLKFKKDDVYEIYAEDSLRKKNDLSKIDLSKGKEVRVSVYKNTNLLDGYNNIKLNDEFKKNINEIGLSYTPVFVKHGVPKKYLFLNKIFSFTSDLDFLIGGLVNDFRNDEHPQFIKKILFKMIISFIDIEDKIKNIDENILRNIIISGFVEFFDIMKIKLADYTPVKDIRLSDNFNVFIDKENNKLTINNLFIELKVQDEWHPFQNLSDGTKRLFYIVSEVSNTGMFNESDKICLVEEPELGIHPHQFMKIMNFLKSESEDKQIIISSHSPLALNVLDNENLNKIIVAYYLKGKGTKLRHLNSKETDKAKNYLEEDYLSDYWVYSDLEK